MYFDGLIPADKVIGHGIVWQDNTGRLHAVSTANPLPVNATVTANATIQTTYHTTPPTLTDGQTDGLEADSNGNLKVYVAGGSTSGTQYTDGGGSATHPIGTGVIFNNAGTYTFVSNSNPLPVTSSGGGLSVADEATWTAGTSNFTPSGGVFNDTATALTAGQQGTYRLTANRAVHSNLRDALGNELKGSKTSANSIPVVIASDQGAVTISGTVTANAGTGNFTVVQSTASSLNAQVVGSIASGSSDSGNPVKIGGVYNSTQPTVTTGQRVDLQMTARGAQIIASGVDAVNVTSTGNVASGSSDSGNPVKVGAVFNTTLPTLTTGQRCDLQVDSSGRLLIGTSASISDLTNSNQYTISTSAVAVPTTPTSTRKGIMVKNFGSTNLFYSTSSGVTNSTGMVLAAGETITLALSGAKTLYFVNGTTNSTANLSAIELI